ncbi:MAG: AarF/UbiB family protein [Bryobacteraceae bacterium]
MKRRAQAAVLWLLAAFSSAWAQQATLGLPTPLDFYRTYDVEEEGKRLQQQFFESLDPQSRKIISKLLEESAAKGIPDIPKDQVKMFVQSLDWKSKKRALLDQVLFRSQVMDIVPPSSRKLWTPIVHDGLVFFLGNLSDERLFDLAWNLSQLKPDAGRGEKIVVLADRIPTLQKLAQMLSRNPDIPLDIRMGLQSMENSQHTTSRADLVALVTKELGEQRVSELKIQFDGKVLAEASIGAVIKAKLVPPGEPSAADVVVKLVKPYALAGLPEEMKVLDQMTEFFERNSKFYQIEAVPVTDLFRQLREAWEKELRVEKEQDHLRQAVAYYAGNPHVKVPRLIEVSSSLVTIMEFIDGEKITDAFKGDPARRAIMARRLFDTLSYEPLYGPREVALFHGDPHAGNVFHVLHNERDPYRIALLDWGVMGRFGKRQRSQLIQLFLGLEYKDRKRMANGIGGLIVGGVPADPARRRRCDEIFDEVFRIKNVKSSYEQLSELVRLLAYEGYKVEQQFGLFIKAQLTIAGILTELDPDFNQIAYAKSRVKRQVLKELPQRILLLPAWNYHGYRSMMSNEDVRDSIF